MRVTIWDVAREAQTSKSTVSKVLRGERRVGRDTKARVEAAIVALGYRPNAAARSLVRRRAQAIAVVVADIRNPFFAEIAHGVTEVARAAGYATILTDLQGTAPSGEDLLDLALEGRADGLILAAWPAAGEPARRLAAAGVPLAFVSCRPIGLAADFVVIDEQRGAELAVRHLVELGHRRIGYIGNADDDSSARERVEGYRAGLAAAGIQFDPALAVTTAEQDDVEDLGSLAGYRAARELVRHRPDTTAIFAADDFVALGAMQALEEDGLLVPRDVSLVGFDDIAFAGLSRIALTTVAQPTDLMGRRVADLLLARLEASEGRQDSGNGNGSGGLAPPAESGTESAAEPATRRLDATPGAESAAEPTTRNLDAPPGAESAAEPATRRLDAPPRATPGTESAAEPATRRLDAPPQATRPAEIVLEPRLVVRGSTAPPRSTSH